MVSESMDMVGDIVLTGIFQYPFRMAWNDRFPAAAGSGSIRRVEGIL